MRAEEFCQKYAIERRGTDSVKWDSLGLRFGDPELLSMWVADMDFKAPEQSIAAIKARAEHGAFGYSMPPAGYYTAFINWEYVRHGYAVEKDWLRFGPGIVTCLYWLLAAFTEPGDAVLILTPVYYPFHNAVRDTERRLVCSELVNTDGVYSVDFACFERDIVENGVKLFILCSPHNPVGRVWTADELDRMFAICQKYGVLVISDEIHQDLIFGEKKHIPSAVVGGGKYADRLITLNAPSKTFNLAGLLLSHIIISDKTLRARYDAETLKVNQTGVNILGLAAGEAAYAHGANWLEGLLAVVWENYGYLCERFEKELPEAVISPLEGTYLAWLDLRAFLAPENLQDFIQEKCRLAVDYGDWFGEKSAGFIRLNLATLPEYVHTAVDNLTENLKAYAKATR